MEITNQTVTGADLRAFREKHSLSQMKLAAAMGVDLSSVNRWEAGGSELSPLAIRAFVAVRTEFGEP